MWGINRLLTKLRHPPKFHGSVLFHIVSEAPTQGVLLAFIPTLLTVLFVWCWFAENSFTASSDPVTSPSAINFEGITGYAATSFVASHISVWLGFLLQTFYTQYETSSSNDTDNFQAKVVKKRNVNVTWKLNLLEG